MDSILKSSGQTVTWNDPGNTNWYEQFIKILTSLAENEKFGNPVKSENIDAIPTINTELMLTVKFQFMLSKNC